MTIYDSDTGASFAGNVIPAAWISLQVAGLLGFYPLPNFTNNQRYNYQSSIVGMSNQDNINSRVSHTLNQKNQFSGNFSYQRASGSGATLAERWNGSRWAVQTTPNPAAGAGVGNVLSGVSCSSSRSCMAVGFFSDTRQHRPRFGESPPLEGA